MGIDRCKQWKSWGSGGEEELGGVSLRPASRSEESEKFHMGGGGGGVGGWAGTRALSCLVCVVRGRYWDYELKLNSVPT